MAPSILKSNNLFFIQPIGFGKCRLSVDLKPYIDSIIHQTNSEELFKQYKRELCQGGGALLMHQFLNSALQSNPELEKINQSDMMNILMINGHEIIKNTLDECLFSCLKDPNHSSIASLEMSIDINHDTVQVVFKDEGKGFPENFLNKFKSDRNIYQYFTESGSHRKISQASELVEFKNNIMPQLTESFDDLTTIEDNFSQRSPSPTEDDLTDTNTPSSVNLSEVKGFGGRGLGLRNLVANIITGYSIQDIKHYIKTLPELSLTILKQNHSHIKLYNGQRGGAQIELELPLEPRKILKIQDIIQLQIKPSSSSIFKSPEVESNSEEELNQSILNKIALKRFKSKK